MNNLIYSNTKNYKITKFIDIDNKRIKLILFIPKIIPIYDKNNKLINNIPLFEPPKNYNICFTLDNILVYYPKKYFNQCHNIIPEIKFNSKYLSNNIIIEEYTYNSFEIYNLSSSLYLNDNLTSFNINAKPFIPNINKKSNKSFNNKSYNINENLYILNNIKNEKEKNNKIKNENNNIKNNFEKEKINLKPYLKNNNKVYIFDIKTNSYIPEDKTYKFNINSKSFTPKIFKKQEFNNKIKSFTPDIYKKYKFNNNFKSFTPDIYKQKKQNTKMFNPQILFKF